MLERISLDDARAFIVSSIGFREPRQEAVPLAQALDRTLGQVLRAPFALPEFTNSAMDGYAVRAADLNGAPVTLPLSQTQLAGVTTRQPLQPGSCARVTTGAALPLESDAVVVQENVRLSTQGVHFAGPVAVGTHVRRAGEDFAQGAVLLCAGQRLGPAELAALASCGYREVQVYVRPKVAILATGSELVAPGEARQLGQIFDSNRYALAALVSALGGEPVLLPLLPDRPEQISEALSLAAAQADLILTSGGASVGDADWLPRVLAELGRVHFWRVRMKPGMPALFGAIAKTPVLALPGNPISVFMSFLCLAKPALELLCGRAVSPLHGYWMPLAHRIDKTHPRREFVRASRLYDPAGGSLVSTGDQGSARHSSLLGAEGALDLPEGARLFAAGELVHFLPFVQWQR